jgi:acyl dehydratase
MTPAGSLTDADPRARAHAPDRSGWSLDDARPGTVIVHPGGRTIDAAEHVWLAWVTHNVSDVHGDAAAAARGEWGQPLVLGMLTAAIVIGLAEPAAGPPDTVTTSMPRGWHRITLERPVVAGATLSAESHIQAVELRPDGGAVEVRRTIIGRDEHGHVVVRIEETRLLPTLAAHAS